MLVESHTRTNALDMTWARFSGCLDALPNLIRINSGRGMNRDEARRYHIEQQKDQKEYEL
jgi:hypothetical protein